MNSRTYAQPKKASAFSVLPVRNPAPRRRSLTPHVGEGHGGFDFGSIPLFSGNESAVQTKLTIGKPGDRYEQEADSMADRVMSMPEPEVQRKCAECDEENKLQRQPEEKEDKDEVEMVSKEEADEEKEEEEMSNTAQAKELRREPAEDEEEDIATMTNELRREADEEEDKETVSSKSLSGGTPQVTPELQNNISSMKGGGQSLPASTRAFFEPRFNHDFSGVRLHTDSRAAETAKSINARAFTIGRNIAFGTGQYSPETSSGKRLLAHELTHTVQQGNSIYKKKAIKNVIQKQETNKKNNSSTPKPRSLTENLVPGEMKLKAIYKEVRLIREWLKHNPKHAKTNILKKSLGKFKSELQRKVCGPKVTEWLKTQMSINGKSAIVKKIRALNESAEGLLSIFPLMAAFQKGRAYSMWRDLVGYKAPWDFKTVLGKNLTNKFLLDCRSPACTGKNYSITLSKRCMTFEAPANIHYGYVGRLAGFSKFEMVYGAAAAGWIKLIAEHPRDKQAIIRGYDLNNAASLSAAGLNLNYYENLDSGEGSKCDPCDKVFKG